MTEAQKSHRTGIPVVQKCTIRAVHSTELIKLFREIERTGEGAPESAFAAVLGIPDEVIERPLEASA